MNILKSLKNDAKTLWNQSSDALTKSAKQYQNHLIIAALSPLACYPASSVALVAFVAMELATKTSKEINFSELKGECINFALIGRGIDRGVLLAKKINETYPKLSTIGLVALCSLNPWLLSKRNAAIVSLVGGAVCGCLQGMKEEDAWAQFVTFCTNDILGLGEIFLGKLKNVQTKLDLIKKVLLTDEQ